MSGACGGGLLRGPARGRRRRLGALRLRRALQLGVPGALDRMSALEAMEQAETSAPKSGEGPPAHFAGRLLFGALFA